jgi:serine/threonine protein kinase
MELELTVIQAPPTAPLNLERLRASLQPRYQVECELGAGGMGQVFLATDVDLERRVALKTILPELCSDPDWVERLRLEARVAAALQHPNLVQVFELLTVEAMPVLVMEYVAGRTLTAMLGEGWLTPQQLTRLLAEVCDGIAYAHARGVIHRDLKPANILLSRDGQPKVSDFGLAVQHQGGTHYRHHASDARIIGSPLFMSPEQAASNTALPDVRSDVYSLGATLYYGLTGRAPFSGKSMDDLIGCVLHQPPQPPSTLGIHISRDLEAICLKALQKNPAERYATAAELADDLRRSLVGLPVRARRYRLWEAIGRALRARKEALIGGLALVALMVASLYAAVSMLTTTAELALMNEIRNKVIDTAQLSTMMLDAELIKTARDSVSKNAEATQQLAAQLDTIRRNSSGVRFICILHQQQRNDPLLKFVVCNSSFLSTSDLDYNQNGLIEPSEEPALPGDIFDSTPYPDMLLGFQKPTADPAHTDLDQWGIALSGYAPLYDRDHHVLGVLAVDISSTQLHADFKSLERSRQLVLLVTMGLALVALVLLLSTLIGLWNRDRLPIETK